MEGTFEQYTRSLVRNVDTPSIGIEEVKEILTLDEVILTGIPPVVDVIKSTVGERGDVGGHDRRPVRSYFTYDGTTRSLQGTNSFNRS